MKQMRIEPKADPSPCFGVKETEFKKIFFWCRLGPIFLLGLSIVAFFKAFSLDFFFLLLSYIGVFFMWKWKARVVPIASLLAVLLIVIYITQELFWPLFFAGAVGLSWWLSFLGEKEVALILCVKESVLRNLVHYCQDQQEQFEEHLHYLHQASEDLALAESKLWEFYIEEKERDLFDLESQVALGGEFREVEEELQELKAQVAFLEGYITTILSEQKPSYPRKAKAKVSQDGMLPIPF